METTYSIVEWTIWAVALALGGWFAFGIRRTAILRAPPPMWPTLILSFSLVFVPLIFLLLPFSKLHILWIVFILWKLSLVAGIGYIPFVSQILIWPAYIYARILTIGMGVSLTSPAKQSPWAARDAGIPLRYLVGGFLNRQSHKLSQDQKEMIEKFMESRGSIENKIKVKCKGCGRPLEQVEIDYTLENLGYEEWFRTGFYCFSCFDKNKHEIRE
ncbi:MAG: hypothetical protein JXM79_23175 [Sedimentisphaerales bacterium]|nr:hypothetical protein [Sedimentisphaerales bacterium]